MERWRVDASRRSAEVDRQRPRSDDYMELVTPAGEAPFSAVIFREGTTDTIMPLNPSPRSSPVSPGPSSEPGPPLPPLLESRCCCCPCFRGLSQRCSDVLADVIIIPDQTPWLGVWDVFIVVVLFVTAFFEPYAVAVLHTDPDWAVVLNHFLDCTFTIDMLMQFFIAFQHPMEAAVSRSLWEKDPCKIAERYCSLPFSQGGRAGWFWVDLMAVSPGWLELCYSESRDNASHRNSFSKVIYILRFCRLIRITKLVRLARLVDKWHAKYGFPFYVVELSKFVLITTLTCHWLACAWIIIEGRVSQGKLSYQTDKESWLSALIHSKGDTCTPDAKSNPICVYIISVYWATMTLTTVGYGDVTPQNQVEYLMCTLCMILVAYIWAFIVGKIVTILSSLDPHETLFRQQTDDIQQLMENRGLPEDLQVRLRGYMHAAKETSKQNMQRGLLEDNISQSLQREVAMCSGVFEDFKRGVYWARELQKDALLDLVRALTPYSFGPNEIMMLPQTLVIMRRGLAAVRGRILNRGDVWGQHDILLETEAIIEKSMPRTLSYVDIVCLSKMNLVKVCTAFPHADRRIRRAQIRTASFRAFIEAAKVEVDENARRRMGENSGSLPPVKKTKLRPEAWTSSSSRQMSTLIGEARSSSVSLSSAVTSFVSPGQNRLQMSSFMKGLHKEVELADLKSLLERINDRFDHLEDRVASMATAMGIGYCAGPQGGGGGDKRLGMIYQSTINIP